MSGAELRVLEAGKDLWLIVSTVTASEYGEAGLERGLKDLDWVGRQALEHEGIVERFLKTPAVLPMQLLTLFTTDARAVDYVTGDRARILRILKRVEGHVEWGLRLTWDELAARQSVERKHARPRLSEGAAFLARKKDLLDVNRVQLEAARKEADRVFRALSKKATDASRRSATERAAPGSRLLLDAAFLVPAGGAAAFRAALKQQEPALRRSGIAPSLTGPWPPYNFIA